MKILVVEDDNSIAQAVATTLAQQQHCLVDIAVDGQEGWELATAFSYDLILLDVMLPKLDGMSLCRQLRHKGNRIPILMLTAKDTSSDKLVGALGSFGFARASHLAQEIESLLEDKNGDRSTGCLRLCQLLEELEEQTTPTLDKTDLGKLFLNQKLFQLLHQFSTITT